MDKKANSSSPQCYFLTVSYSMILLKYAVWKMNHCYIIYCVSQKKQAPKIATNMMLYQKHLNQSSLPGSFTYLIAMSSTSHQQQTRNEFHKIVFKMTYMQNHFSNFSVECMIDCLQAKQLEKVVKIGLASELTFQVITT